MQSSSSAPAINNNTNNDNNNTNNDNNNNNNNPSSVPPETPAAPAKTTETIDEPISSVLSPLQLCEQNAAALVSLLARMPPLPLSSTSSSSSPGSAIAEGPGPDQGPAQAQGLDPGLFDWRMASLRRVTLFSGGCQAAMSSIAQVIYSVTAPCNIHLCHSSPPSPLPTPTPP